jgi:hypothetical protein
MWLSVNQTEIRVMEHEGDYQGGDTLVHLEPVRSTMGGVKVEVIATPVTEDN